MKNRIILVIAAAMFLVLGLSVIKDVNKSNQELHIKRIELQNNERKLKTLESDFKKLNGAKAENEQQIRELEQKRQQLEKEKSDLEAQLQAKAELKARQAKVYAAAAPTVPFTQRSQPVAGCGDNSYANYIYQHESGCRLDAVNPIGACGIGQALPCSKLSSVCPNWTSDYACQNSFFTQYCMGISKGAGWATCYNIWVSKSWW